MKIFRCDEWLFSGGAENVLTEQLLFLRECVSNFLVVRLSDYFWVYFSGHLFLDHH